MFGVLLGGWWCNLIWTRYPRAFAAFPWLSLAPAPCGHTLAPTRGCSGARAIPGVHLVHVGLRQVAHVGAPEAGAPGEELAQADCAIEHRARHREGPARVGIEMAVRQHEPRPDRTGVGTREQEVGHPADRLRVDGHRRAQQENEAALAALEAEVGGPAVAQVFRLHQHGRLRE